MHLRTVQAPDARADPATQSPSINNRGKNRARMDGKPGRPGVGKDRDRRRGDVRGNARHDR